MEVYKEEVTKEKKYILGLKTGNSKSKRKRDFLKKKKLVKNLSDDQHIQKKETNGKWKLPIKTTYLRSNYINKMKQKFWSKGERKTTVPETTLQVPLRIRRYLITKGGDVRKIWKKKHKPKDDKFIPYGFR